MQQALTTDLSQAYNPDRVNQMLKMADTFVASGAFGGNIDNAAQAFAIIQAGYEMGFGPMKALNSLYIVKGKIVVYGSAQAELIKRAGYQIKYEDKTGSCKVTVSKGDEVYTFEATSAMLKSSQAFKFAPMEKLRYHALSRILRFDLPHVVNVGNVYYEGEIVDVQTVDAEASQQNQKQYNKAIEAIEAAKSLDDLKAAKELAAKDMHLYSDEQKAEFKQYYKDALTRLKPEPEVIDVEPETGEVIEEPSGEDKLKSLIKERTNE